MHKTKALHFNLKKLSWSEAYHCDEAADEAEVGEVVGVDWGGGVYLQAVIVLPGVFEQAVHGVQDFVGQQEEPLPAERQVGGHYCTDSELEFCRAHNNNNNNNNKLTHHNHVQILDQSMEAEQNTFGNSETKENVYFNKHWQQNIFKPKEEYNHVYRNKHLNKTTTTLTKL